MILPSAPFWVNVFLDREGLYASRMADPTRAAAELSARLTERLGNVRCVYRLKVTPKPERRAAA